MLNLWGTLGSVILSDTKIKLLLSQEWLTLENVSYFFNGDIYSTLQTCLLRSISILYTQPKHLQFKENKSHRGFYQEFSKSYKYKDRLDYEHFYRIGRSSSIKTMTDDILGLEVSILQILSLYDESNEQEFEIKMIDFIGGKKTKYGKILDENDNYGIAFCKPYIELDECDINVFIKVSDFIYHFKDMLGLEQYIPNKPTQSKPNQETSHEYSKALDPYNDIILAFDNESEKYKQYKNTITKEVIRDELRINYKKLLSSNEKAEFVADLIIEHYNIPKGNRKK